MRSLNRKKVVGIVSPSFRNDMPHKSKTKLLKVKTGKVKNNANITYTFPPLTVPNQFLCDEKGKITFIRNFLLEIRLWLNVKGDLQSDCELIINDQSIKIFNVNPFTTILDISPGDTLQIRNLSQEVELINVPNETISFGGELQLVEKTHFPNIVVANINQK